MVLLDVQPWMRFTIGLVVGCWIGVAVGLAIVMLLTGRRLRQLETANLVLRLKLRARERARRSATGAGPILVAKPGGGVSQPVTGTRSRFAGGAR
jgi:hypothetical protein